MKNKENKFDTILTKKERKDLRLLAQFTSVYCQDHHSQRNRLAPDFAAINLRTKKRFHCCEECREFLSYAIERRLRCPLDPKPMCKHCEVHCFRPGHREKVREVMRHSGRALIKRGRIDLLWHYFF